MSESNSARGHRLREARRARGLSQAEVADALGISRPTLIAVEQGRREPAAVELVRMAELYGREVHELVRDTAPVEALTARFRLAPGTDEGTATAVDDLQRLADDVLEVEGISGAPSTRPWPDPYDVDGLPVDLAAEQLATQERRRLGLGGGPLNRLRDVLENEIGLRVFAMDLPSHLAGLFAVAEPAGACIAFNAAHPHERQRWTMAHEYFHFLHNRGHTEATELEPSRVREERLAEAFAARLLMPEEGLVRRFQAIRRSRQGAFFAVDLLQLADEYEVSAQAMALRLENLRLIQSGWWDGLHTRGLRVNAARAELGIDLTPRDQRTLPLRTQYLAVSAFLKGWISEGRLARTLRTDRASARTLISELTVLEDVAEGGTSQFWSIDVEDGDRIG